MKHHVNLILNHFPSQKRRSLLRWMQKSSGERGNYHNAFWSSLNHATPKTRESDLDNRTKIALTVLDEFGSRLSPNAIQATIEAVEKNLHR